MKLRVRELNFMAASVNSRLFGVLPSGESVEARTLRGANGLEVEAITYGGIVTQLLAPDRDGLVADVVLGLGCIEDYLAGHPYFGAIIGRVAGRIAGAKFVLEGETHKLCSNDAPNHLHGGDLGFDKKLWKVKVVERPDGAPSIRFTVLSPEKEEGYPGNMEVNVTYTVKNNNVFLIETDAITDRPTPVSLTHHSYFNLAGEGAGSVEDHELQIFADQFVPTDLNMTPLGRLECVIPGENDFRQLRELGAAIPRLHKRHGDLYGLRKAPITMKNDTLQPAARLVHNGSGRVLDVFTTESYLQLYTGASLDGSLVGKSGVRYGSHSGVCLECEGYPDGVNTPSLGSTILRPGEELRQTTAYAFSTLAVKNPFRTCL